MPAQLVAPKRLCTQRCSTHGQYKAFRSRRLNVVDKKYLFDDHFRLKDSHAAQELTTKTLESKVADLELSWKDAAGRLLEIQRCLSALHDRVTSMKDADRSTGLLQTVISDIMKLSLGDAQISDTPPRSPSPAANLPEKKWSRITDEESRQNNIRAMNRLRQLTERLKNSDGKLISPTASPHQEAKVGNAESSARPKDLIISNPSNLSETDAEQLFAKQVKYFVYLKTLVLQSLLHVRAILIERRSWDEDMAGNRSVLQLKVKNLFECCGPF